MIVTSYGGCYCSVITVVSNGPNTGATYYCARCQRGIPTSYVYETKPEPVKLAAKKKKTHGVYSGYDRKREWWRH